MPDQIVSQAMPGALPDRVGVSLTVNGVPRRMDILPWTTLLDLLREDLHLTGTKKGCDHGQCGSCTVLLDGQRINACLVLAVTKDGSAVTTVEGLAAPDGTLHPIQQAMMEAHGFQCAFCSPGFLMSSVALLAENAEPTRAEIREELSGNLCRCTGYQSIVAGIERAVEVMKASGR